MRWWTGLIIGFVITIDFSAVVLAQTHFTFRADTGNNATIGIPTTANPNIGGVSLAIGDEIGVFTPAGLCVGAVVWGGTNTALTVWEDDNQTPVIDGIRSGEPIGYRVWQKATDTEYTHVSVTYSQGNGIYVVDGIYLVASLSAVVPPSALPLRGDVNHSGLTTVLDGVLILRFVVGLEEENTLTAPSVARDFRPETADVSGDGRISAIDAALIFQFDAGIITSFPAMSPKR